MQLLAGWRPNCRLVRSPLRSSSSTSRGEMAVIAVGGGASCRRCSSCGPATSRSQGRADREARASCCHHWWSRRHGNLSAVWSDDAGAVVDVVRYLGRLRHERIAASQASPSSHTEIRSSFLRDHGGAFPFALLVTTDYMAETGDKCHSPALSTARSDGQSCTTTTARRRRARGRPEMGLSSHVTYRSLLGTIPFTPRRFILLSPQDPGHRRHGDARGERTDRLMRRVP